MTKIMQTRFTLLLLAVLLLPLASAQDNETITIGMNELVTSMDPPADWAIASTWIHMNLFDCLVWRNRETGAFEPWLATSYENIDELTWRMTLREGVTFHNGEVFDADAVKWTYERITSASRDEFITFNQWTFIEEITALSPYEVEIVTTGPEPAFLSKMAGTGCGIQAPVAGQEMAESDEYMPIGTGPYMLEEFVRDDFVTMSAFQDYWQGAPDVETIIWRAIPETSTRIANLLTSDVDLIVSVPPQDWERINSNDGTEVQEYLTTRVMLLALRAGANEQYPEWEGLTSDPLIREAIRLAIDRELLIEVIEGMGVPVLSRITPPNIGWSEEFYDTVGEYDPERAMQLLEEAGYDGEPITFQSSTSWLLQQEVAEVIAAMLETVGFNVDLQVMDVTTFREQVYFPYRNEEIYMDALGNSFFDPWITVLSERSDRRERSGWSGPEADMADTLIRSAAANMDAEARADEYLALQEVLVESAPTIPLYQMKDAVGINSNLNWSMPLDGFLWFGNAELE